MIPKKKLIFINSFLNFFIIIVIRFFTSFNNINVVISVFKMAIMNANLKVFEKYNYY